MSPLIPEPTEAVADDVSLEAANEFKSNARRYSAQATHITSAGTVVKRAAVMRPTSTDDQDRCAYQPHRGFIFGLAVGSAGTSACVMGALTSAFGIADGLFWSMIGLSALGLAGSCLIELLSAKE